MKNQISLTMTLDPEEADGFTCNDFIRAAFHIYCIGCKIENPTHKRALLLDVVDSINRDLQKGCV